MIKITTEQEQIIARYLNGECSPDEEKALKRWISEDPAHEKYFWELKDSWDASLKPKTDTTEQLLKFYQKQAGKNDRFTLPRWASWGAAAAILVIGLVIGGIWQQRSFHLSSQVESFQVPLGSRSHLTLADGTQVNLNSGSSLTLGKGFSAKHREVKLTGEGYFQVKSDKKHPFTVKTDKFDVTVTGTKFNISSYATDQKISATLAEGHIKLSTINHKVIDLHPGQKISFDQQTMNPQLEQADVESELAWVKGEFIFKEIPFPDLIKRLERWYDVKLKYKGTAFNKMLYSGSFKNQETIWQVLDALKLTTPIDYKKINFREFELIYKPM
ncbi:MAG TPA: FecR domain-containing protein [Sunxiuqinia sp.]|nr:FecR domain-containing protein [Sunxiuqinia sp.]